MWLVYKQFMNNELSKLNTGNLHGKKTKMYQILR